MAKANTKNKISPPTAPHPPYLEMITDAITTLKERKGSSQTSIAMFIEEKHKKSLPSNFNKLLSVQLNKFVKSEKLLKVINCYKISSNSTKETTNKTITATPPPKQKGKRKIVEKTTITTAQKKSAVVKVKRLSQVMTPEGMKKKNSNLTPTKRKSTPKPVNSTRPAKKARK
ncbi:PREDICTED: histone H1-like isoform X2 [Lupinus angustifolius]|uniref:histone H1-like isoform X2 n=1 Tax=Lupinus angustifolius TaxID=3871 RepID=UPI00092FA168|nr:PREDICTED: histone H1-like isoform X2 [Lupinus angustifolius]